MASESTSISITDERRRKLEAIAEEWGCSRSEAVGRLVDGYVLKVAPVPPVPEPPPRRYRVLADYSGGVHRDGVMVPVVLFAGQTLAAKYFPTGHFEELSARGCKLELVAD